MKTTTNKADADKAVLLAVIKAGATDGNQGADIDTIRSLAGLAKGTRNVTLYAAIDRLVAEGLLEACIVRTWTETIPVLANDVLRHETRTRTVHGWRATEAGTVAAARIYP
jgi:hypothetical protein